MAHEIRVLLFGDQSGDVIGELWNLVLTKGNPILSSFFEQAYVTLRDEVASNPEDTQDVPEFTSIETLLSRYAQEEVHNPAIESALVYIHQVATVLRHAGDEIQTYPKPQDTILVGLCTGLLAAASVSCARTYLQLLKVSVEVLKLAFRIGTQVSRRCNEIKRDSDGQASWSAIFPGVDKQAAEQALEDFYSGRVIPSTSCLYLSAISKTAVTISGPPSELDALIDSGILKSSRAIRIPIYGPYHSPTLYSDKIVAALLGTIPETISAEWIPRIPVALQGKDSVYTPSTYHELMQEVIQDILQRPLDWETVCTHSVASVNAAQPEQCRIAPVGAQSSASSLINHFTNQNSAFRVFLDDEISGNPQPSETTGRQGKSKIAIVGMSGRFPDAASPSDFWDLLKQGLDVHREIPEDRFDAQAHYDPDGKRKNTSHTPYGCFVEHPGLFDAKFFSMSPKEAIQTDPMHRLALLTAYEALEMSGFVPNRTPSSAVDRVGTFYGQTSDDWREIQDAQTIQTYFIPGGVRAFAPGRINYHFGFSGPSFSVDTACSSSLAAINIACNSLWLGECDTALAGGLNILTNPDIFAGLSRGQFLSKTGNCKTYDDDADGYCRGDGAGTVILKRLEDAEADNDPILATILGTGTNHSADAVSITHPHAENQEHLFKRVLNECGMDPHDISYVEMHGTGTQAGDAIEMESVLNSFAPEDRKRPEDQPLYIGSVKSNVGHGEAASGVTALVKVLLMLDHGLIPPHCGIKNNINHNFPDLGARNVHISRGRESAWKRPEGGKRNLFLNNFSAAGGNTSLLMEDSPLTITDGMDDPRSTAVVAVSAKTKTAFFQNIENLVEYLAKNPEVHLPSLSYTTTARRVQYQYRTIVSGSNVAEIEAGLRKALDADVSPVNSSKTSVVFIFTGQGSHYTAMGKQLYDTIPQFRSDIERFNLIAENQGFPGIIPLIDGSTPIESLSPVVVQTGAVCIQMALVRLWDSLGVKPSVVLGHSLGEYAALYAAGVLSINDAIFLTATRATILEKTCTMNTHAMLAVNSSPEELTDVIDGTTYELACVNGPKATVISGQSDKIDQLQSELASKNLKCTKLTVPFAFHSSQVEPALDEFEKASSGIKYNTPTTPVISPLLSSVINDQGTINSQYLRGHFRSTVNFFGGMKAAEEAKLVDDSSVFIEIGSHPVCSGMVKSIRGSTTVATPSLRRDEDVWTTLPSSLCALYRAGVDIDWNNYHKAFPECHNTLRLPAYGWEATNYWIDYKNNWCLTKGEDIEFEVDSPQKTKNSLLTSTVQRIVEEKLQGQTGTLTSETDISHPDLEETMKGHIVNGSALCSSAVYADMALTIGNYIHRKLEPENEDFGMNCSNMTVEKPLVYAGGAKPQLLRTHTSVDMSRGLCEISFYSVNDKGKKVAEHAHCHLEFDDPNSWSLKLSRQKYLIQSQLDRLLQGGQSGQLSKLSRNMAYKLFSALVDYQKAYKGMAEVVLDSPNREGTAQIELQTNSSGNFFIAPFQIDSLCHLAGFIMNANDELDSSQTVYVNHGWDSLQFSEKPIPDHSYRSYVRMQPTEPDSKDFSGDVYVFNDDGDIIGLIGGIYFQYLPKQVLDRALPAPGGAKSSASNSSSTAKAAAPQKTTTPKAPKEETEKAPKKANSAPAGSSNISRVLDIMADEIGVSASELSDDSELAALGVDSLMSLTISGKIQEELELEISSSVLSDCQLVKEVKDIISQNSPEFSSAEPDQTSDSATESTDNSGTSTPRSSNPETPDSEVDEEANSDGADKISVIHDVVCEETGLETSELTSSTDLADAGIDSLMALQILGTLSEEKGLDLPPTFFSEHETFGDIEKALGGGKSNGKPPTSVPSESIPADSSETLNPPGKDIKSSYRAGSFVLQGKPAAATHTVFLLPDGSGSPTSYVSIPSVAPQEVAIIALSCPFMKAPDAFDCGIEGVAKLYIEEIQRRQPKGPYIIGGWSAGGICAYEACLQLQAAGEEVEKLLYFDVPCPLPPQELPPRLHEFLDSIGLLGAEGEAPDWLLPHFSATVRALSAYRPKIMDPAKDKIPKTYTVMARDGVCKNDDDPRPDLSPDDPPHMGFLLFNRTDFGPMGWENLLGSVDNIVQLEPISEANHFTMMREPAVKEIPSRIREALGVSG